MNFDAVISYVERHPKKIMIVLFLIIIMSYYPSLNGAVLLDDEQYIFKNQNIQQWSTSWNYLHNFYLSRGWTQLLFSIDLHFYKAIGVPVKLGMHCSNIFYHCLACFVLMMSIKKFWKLYYRDDATHFHPTSTGLITAAIFGLHPISSQPVCHLISRADILATLWFLGIFYISLVLYERYAQRFSDFIFFPFSSLFLSVLTFIGLGFKEIILPVPLLCLISILVLERNSSNYDKAKKAAFYLLPFVVIAFIYVYLHALSTGGFFNIPDAKTRPFNVNLYTQICVIVLYYFPRIIFPINLFYDPYFPLIASMVTWKFAFSFVFLLSLLLASIVTLKKNPVIFLGVAWFFATIAITSSFIPLADVIAERRIYLPLIGFALIVESVVLQWKFYKLTNLRWIYASIGILCFVIYPSLTLMKSYEYSNEEIFWKRENINFPQKMRPLFQLMYAQFNKGNTDEAIKIYKDRIQFVQLGENHETYNAIYIHNLVRFLAMNKIDLPNMKVMAEKMVQTDPKSLQTLYTLELVYFFQEDYNQSMIIIDRLLSLFPTHLPSLLNKVNVFIGKNDTENADKLLQSVLNQFPNSDITLEIAVKFYKSIGKENRDLEDRLAMLKKSQMLNASQTNTKIIENKR